MSIIEENCKRLKSYIKRVQLTMMSVLKWTSTCADILWIELLQQAGGFLVLVLKLHLMVITILIKKISVTFKTLKNSLMLLIWGLYSEFSKRRYELFIRLRHLCVRKLITIIFSWEFLKINKWETEKFRLIQNTSYHYTTLNSLFN